VKKLNVNEVLAIKFLSEKGYKDNHIAMVMKVHRSYVYKLKKGLSRKDVKLDADTKVSFTEEQKRRLKTLDDLLAAPELMTAGTSEQDMIYMHVLRFFGFNKEEISNLYFHLSRRQIANFWVKADVQIVNFDSRLIGIEIKDYLDLIIDCFI